MSSSGHGGMNNGVKTLTLSRFHKSSMTVWKADSSNGWGV